MKKVNANELRKVEGGWVLAAAAGLYIGRTIGIGLYKMTHNGYYPKTIFPH